MIKNSTKHQNVVKALQQTDVLIIDECSMVSSRTLSQVSEVLSIKDSTLHFGGIQVILVGDFYQLPPVKDTKYSDSGQYCFENKLIHQFPHRVVLTKVERQSDPTLISACTEVSEGKISADTAKYIYTLNSTNIDPKYKLLATNDLVDDHNRMKILQHKGELVEYISSDSGNTKELARLTVPKVLWLKVCIPVILLRNLSSHLVNGLQDIVTDIGPEGPVVLFAGPNVTMTLKKFNFQVFSPKLGVNVASREQYPIKPAFGITIHKAQGMTLDSIEVDCQHIFQAGQLGVAMSRVKTAAGLRIIHFHPKVCISHPPKVKMFLQESSLEAKADRSCCRNKIRDVLDASSKVTVKYLLSLPMDVDVQPSDEDFDEDFNEALMAMDSEVQDCVNFELPDEFKRDNTLKSLVVSQLVFPSQVHNNRIIDSMSTVKTEMFLKKEFLIVTALIDQLNITEPRTVKHKEQAALFTEIHKHLTSVEYRMNCLSLFDGTGEMFSDDHMSICFRLHVAVRLYLLKQKANLYQTENKKMRNRHLTNPSKARLRYVAGYCVAKVRHGFNRKKSTHRFSTTSNSQTIYEESECAVQILDSMKEEEEHLKATTADLGSLEDIDRRQYLSSGLTNITDSIFGFFVEASNMCLSFLIEDNMSIYGKDIFHECTVNLLKDVALYSKFTTAISSPAPEVDPNVEFNQKQMFIVFEKLSLDKLSMVLYVQFRKDMKETFKIENTMAHQKQIQTSKSTSTVKPSTSTCTSTLTDPPNPSTSTSGEKPTSARKKSKRAKGSYLNETGQTVWVCPSCGEEDDGDQAMIGCDSCDEWFHWSCVGIKEEPNKEIWKCPACDENKNKRPRRGKGKARGRGRAK